MRLPTLSTEYFPYANMASRYRLQDEAYRSPTPRLPPTSFDTHNSGGSSDVQPSNPSTTPRLSGNTPPSSYKMERTLIEKSELQAHSLSASPDRQHGRRSNASLTSTLSANMSRGLSHSSSSERKRLNLGRSTSGSLTPGGVTWGVNTFINPSANEAHATLSATFSESDADEEKLQATGPTSVKVVMRNQTGLDCEGYHRLTLLDPTSAVQHRGYRAAYANILAEWGFEMRRLELLKFDGLQGPSPTESTADQSFASTLSRKDSKAHEPSVWRGLEITGFCQKCGGRLQRERGAPQDRRGDEWRCTSCQRRQQRMACSICYEMVSGLYAPCLACGHAAHSDCHRAWFRQPERECPTGCGCQCAEAALRTLDFL